MISIVVFAAKAVGAYKGRGGVLASHAAGSKGRGGVLASHAAWEHTRAEAVS